jgi:uncharacterized membrane protein
VKKYNAVRVIARGALGGVIGGFILSFISVLYYVFGFAYMSYPHLLIIGLLLLIVTGALVGGLVGTAIWIFGVIMKRDFGSIGRAIIGFVTASVVIVGFVLTRSEDAGFGREPASWSQQAIWWVVVGVILGVLPGLMTHSQRKLV